MAIIFLFLRLMARQVLAGFALVAAMSLLGCAPGAMESKLSEGQKGQGTTGYVGVFGPALSGGDQRVEAAKAELRAANPERPTFEEQKRAELAAQVNFVKVERFNSKGQTERFGTHSAKVSLQLVGIPERELTFNLLLTKGTKGALNSAESVSVENKNYAIKAEFVDGQDQSFFEGRLDLRSYTQKQLHSEIPIFLRTYLAKVELRQDSSDPSTEVSALKKAKAWVENRVVTLGHSFYDMQVVEASENSSEALLFTLSGEAIRTHGANVLPAPQSKSGHVRVDNVELLGDAETSDLRAFSLDVESASGRTSRIALVVEKEQKSISTLAPPPLKRPPVNPAPPSLPTLRPPSSPRVVPELKAPRNSDNILLSESYFNLPYGQGGFERLTRVVDHFQANYDLPGVQKEIQKLTTQQNLSYLGQNLTRMISVRDLIEEVFHQQQVPASTSLLTLLESAFFKSDAFVIDYGPGTSAVGPYQFLAGTAGENGMKVSNSGREPWDERRYLVPSICAAARYSSTLIDHFIEYDATLAIMAYNQGPEGAASVVTCSMKNQVCAPNRGEALKLYQRYGFTFRDVSRLNMARGKMAEAVTYVNRFLAHYFVSQTPRSYGLSWQEQGFTRVPKTTLLPPAGRLSDSSCERAARQSLNLSI